MELQGKVALVTGGASGIGKALAARFVREGARQVVIADIDANGLEEVAASTGAFPIPTDVRSDDEVKNLIRTTEEKYGQIDLLCNNAGIFTGGTAGETSDDAWQRIWEINVLAHVRAVRYALPDMIRRGEGYLLNTASAAGLLSQIGSAPYAVTKHAAVGLAEILAITHGHQGIKVTVLCPQAVRTAMVGSSDGGVAGVDGLMEPEQLCDEVIASLAKEEFLCLPHKEVRTYFGRKASDYDRWIRGMQRLQERFSGGAI